MDNLEKRLQSLEYRLGTLERLLDKLAGQYIKGAESELEAARIETLDRMRQELGQLSVEYNRNSIGKLG